MKNNGGLFAGVAVILALLGVSSLPKRSSDSSGAAESGKPAVPPAKQAAKSKKPNEPCEEIAKRLKRFLTASDAARPLDHWRLPDSCYDQAALQTGLPKVQPVSASPDVRFVIATVPNPVSTHLALMFDRNIEAIQQAAQDNHDLYDDSWFPWDTTKDYALLDDQHLADDLLKNQESQPGVMLFRREIPDDQSKPPYEGGLIVFLVGEKPTGGLSDDQFEHALEWVSRLGGLKSEAPLRILGPSFSGSLPSLSRDLEQSNTLNRLDGEKFRVKAHLKVSVSSGMVSSSSGYHWFRTWIQKWQSGSDFWTAMENDFLIAAASATTCTPTSTIPTR